MLQSTTERALKYVSELELPARVLGGMVQPAGSLAAGKDQSVLVGSDITSFVKTVSPEQRQDIINATLLAQLVAKKRVPDASEIDRWYDQYFDVLSNIGWLIQDRQFATYAASGEGFEAQ